MQYSRVLLIDDDEDDQELFLLAMKEIAASIECITLDNARSALTQLENRALIADVIFLDLNMPAMTGQQFLTELNKREVLSRIPSLSYPLPPIPKLSIRQRCWVPKASSQNPAILQN